ncbi:hypothetical protein PLEOSDRAFT_161937 [Pleurotus ostreatus PC15]|uniref:Uncharacterized protein n=1 Tax=Pleurotus ostreatus (strain PC15) TaxID=1137138 RepID=A0A067NAU5_PLEO1|nr:hypothetical protein PLEOSDRAFT_161937 [Pleurotus ostreatus PC15]
MPPLQASFKASASGLRSFKSSSSSFRPQGSDYRFGELGHTVTRHAALFSTPSDSFLFVLLNADIHEGRQSKNLDPPPLGLTFVYGDDNEFLDGEWPNGTSTAQQDGGADEEPVSPVSLATTASQTPNFALPPKPSSSAKPSTSNSANQSKSYSAQIAQHFPSYQQTPGRVRRHAPEHEADTMQDAGNPHNDRSRLETPSATGRCPQNALMK